MLGNDVVDLLDVDARPETFHRRFEARVFAPSERESIARDAAGSGSPTHPHPNPHPHALRWAHWAAKEAAYKLLRQRDPEFVFSPIRLVARFDAAGSGRLTGATRGGRLEIVRAGESARPSGLAPDADPDSLPIGIELESFETNDFVHVLALPAGGDWGRVVCAVERLGDPSAERSGASSGGPSAQPRADRRDPSAAVRRLALREIARALDVAPARLAIGRRGRIPILELDGRPASVALSLSHHGRFVAFAMVPRGRGLRLVPADGAVAEAGSDEDGARRDGTGVGHVAQRVGGVGSPARLADAERMAG